MIHFNNAGASLPPPSVIEAQVDYLRREAEVGGYRLAQVEAHRINDFYPAAAEVLSAHARNIAWVGSATEAFNRAVSSIHWSQGDIVLTTRADYVSNQLAFLQLQQRYGIQLERLPDGASGYDPDALKDRLAKGPLPRLISITHVPTNRGIAQDIITAGKLARQYGIWYLVDACQSLGQLPLDVSKIGCDFLCATSRKYLRGPRGGGLLYVSDRVLESGLTPLGVDMQSAEWKSPSAYRPVDDAKRFETWERSPATQLATAVALRHLLTQDRPAIYERIQALAQKLWLALDALPHTRMVDPLESLGSGLVLAYFPELDIDPDTLINRLFDQGLNVKYSTVAGDQYDFKERGIDWALRASVHYFNEEQEVDTAIDIFRQSGLKAIFAL
ncbi:MAG: aminotransferase class V-fold PLP-dependent enzyme [Bacteroidota bacterium]